MGDATKRDLDGILSELQEVIDDAEPSYFRETSPDMQRIDDCVHRVIKNYVESDYCQQEIFTRDTIFDYKKFSQILKFNLSLSVESRNNVKEMIECTEFDPEGYVTLKKLGEGGSGKVFLAKRIIGEEVSDTPIAIKLFKLEGLHPKIKDFRDRTSLRKVIMEQFEKLADINHPNIIRMYLPEEYKDSLIVPMEYMNGGDLEKFSGKLNHKQLHYCVKSMLSGIQYLHSKGIVLGDVKLENMLVKIVKPLEESYVKIGDLETLISLEKLGIPGRISPVSNSYASPQVIQGEKASVASDLYALGACIYYLASGEKPSATGFIAQLNHLDNEEKHDKIMDKGTMRLFYGKLYQYLKSGWKGKEQDSYIMARELFLMGNLLLYNPKLRTTTIRHRMAASGSIRYIVNAVNKMNIWKCPDHLG